MDNLTAQTIWIAAGSVAAFVAPFISWYLSRERSQRWLDKVSPSAKRLLNKSTWHGKGTVDTGDSKYRGDYETHMHLDVEGKLVFGEYNYTALQGVKNSPEVMTPSTTIQIRGGFAKNGYLRLNYQTDLAGEIYFGVFILCLDEKKREVSGKWVGLGNHAKDIINGSAVLQRVI